MFERFTDRARRVLVLAQAEATELRHNFIGTEHVLLGLIKEGSGVAAKVLGQLGVHMEETRETVLKTIGPGSPDTDLSGKPPFTPRSKKVLELSLREAIALGHNYIGTEHLLLGLITEGEGVAAQILIQKGVVPATVRATVMAELAKYGPAKRDATHTPAGSSLEFAARAAAGVNAVGTHHYLLAMANDPTSLAGKILASLGVMAEGVRSRIDELGTYGTTDAEPEKFETSASEGGVVIRINDPGLAAKVRSGELAVTFAAPDQPTPEPEPETTPDPEAPEAT